MWKVRFGVAVLALAYAISGVASARDTSFQPATTIAPTQEGISAQVLPGGFALVTLGTWPTKASNIQTQLAVRTSDAVHPSLIRASRIVGKFRRAIYLGQVQSTERRYGLPNGLLDALIWTESRYNPVAVSKAGAAGLGQLMPRTAQALGIFDRYNAFASIDGAARYLRQMLDRFDAVHLAIAAYNAGPGAVERSGGIPRNDETPAYVREVLRNWVS